MSTKHINIEDKKIKKSDIYKKKKKPRQMTLMLIKY